MMIPDKRLLLSRGITMQIGCLHNSTREEVDTEKNRPISPQVARGSRGAGLYERWYVGIYRRRFRNVRKGGNTQVTDTCTRSGMRGGGGTSGH